MYISTDIYLTTYQSNQIYINWYISHYQPYPVNLDVSTNRILILYKDYITSQTKIPTMNFKPWSSNHPLSGAITSTRTNNSGYQVSGPTVTPGHWNQPSRYRVWMVQMGVGTSTSTRPNTLKPEVILLLSKLPHNLQSTHKTGRTKYSQTWGYTTPK